VSPCAEALLLLPVHIRKGDIDVRLFGTIMTLGTALDATLQDLRVETFFPADEDRKLGSEAPRPEPGAANPAEGLRLPACAFKVPRR